MVWVELSFDVKGIGKKGKYGYVSAFNFDHINLIGHHCTVEVGVLFEGTENIKYVPVWALERSYNKKIATEIEYMIKNAILTKDVAIRICKKYNL